MVVGSQCSTFLRPCPACTRLHKFSACCAMQHINDKTPSSQSRKEYADLSFYVLVPTSNDVDVLAHRGCGVTGSLQRHRTITSSMSCVSGTSPADHTPVNNHYCCYNNVCAGMSRLAPRSTAGCHVQTMCPHDLLMLMLASCKLRPSLCHACCARDMHAEHYFK